tara:strand:+ start:379 stop:585 length:207 start_codon:yes stop_codon:yes gene_type:complete
VLILGNYVFIIAKDLAPRGLIVLSPLGHRLNVIPPSRIVLYPFQPGQVDGDPLSPEACGHPLSFALLD